MTADPPDSPKASRPERRMLARRLHDGPVQQITAAALFVEEADIIAGEQASPQLRAALDRARTAMDCAATDCRVLMSELLGEGDASASPGGGDA